jgi:hypothetical protein
MQMIHFQLEHSIESAGYQTATNISLPRSSGQIKPYRALPLCRKKEKKNQNIHWFSLTGSMDCSWQMNAERAFPNTFFRSGRRTASVHFHDSSHRYVTCNANQRRRQPEQQGTTVQRLFSNALICLPAQQKYHSHQPRTRAISFQAASKLTQPISSPANL